MALHSSESRALTGSADHNVRIWDTSKAKAKCLHIVKTHNSAVTGISMHPSGQFFLSASEDGQWAFHELASGHMLNSATDEPGWN